MDFTAINKSTRPTILAINPTLGINVPISINIAPIPPKTFALLNSPIFPHNIVIVLTDVTIIRLLLADYDVDE